jgi:hypothetical protein
MSPPDDGPLNLTRCCPLPEYAKVKGLRSEFQRELGVEEFLYNGRPALRIPYRNADKSLFRHRLRRALYKKKDVKKDGRFAWDERPDSTGVILYGLDRLPPVAERSDKTLIIVEGESDAQTAWFHGMCALGVPGASNFNPKRDDPHLEGWGRIIVIQEPGDGGETLVRLVLESAHRKRISVVRLDGFKDLNELHVAYVGNAAGFRERLDAAIAAAIPLDEWARKDEKPAGEHTTGESLIDEKIGSEVERLAGLTKLQYERARKDAAKKLDLRPSVLDQLVQQMRNVGGDTAGQGRPLELPEHEPWSEPVDGVALLDELVKAVSSYVVLAEHVAIAIALWVVHCCVFDVFMITPRLAITSPERRCGKTTLLDVLGCLVWRPLSASNVTASVVFRVVEQARPTLLIDEADTFLVDNDELRGVLNTGHRQGGQVIRNVGENHEPRAFSTHAPAAIAMIGELPGTLADRSVPVPLTRRRADELVKSFRLDQTGHLSELARKVKRWTDDSRDRLAQAEPEMPAGIFNRDADNWCALLAIADAAGGDWRAKARQAALALLTGDAVDEQDSDRVHVLADIRTIITDKDNEHVFPTPTDGPAIFSADLCRALHQLEGRPWAEYSRGKPLTQHALAKLLKHFKIKPRGTLRNGLKTNKGYRARDFSDAFTRFLPPEGGIQPSHRHTPRESRDSGPSATVTPDEDVTVEKPLNPATRAECDDVTVTNGGQGRKSREPVWEAEI